MEVKYSLMRSEIWNCYWSRWWNGGLYWFHLQLFLIISIGFLYFDYKYGVVSVNTFIKSVAAFVGTFTFMVLYPQLMYKPQIRTLAINENGIHTQIAKYDKVIPWLEVSSLENSDGYIKISGRNKNTMLIPERAFSDVTEMQTFYEYAMEYVKKEAKNA